MKNSKNSGHTLVETMIYMVLGIIVIGYALSAMTDISKGYVRNRTVMKMQSDGRDAVQVMARDISNLGLKFYVLDTTLSTKKKFNGTSFDTKNVDYYVTLPLNSTASKQIITNYDSTSSSPPKISYIHSRVNWLYASYYGQYNDSLPKVDSAASFEFAPATSNEVTDLLWFIKGVPNKDGAIRRLVKVGYYVEDDTLFRDETIVSDSLLDLYDTITIDTALTMDVSDKPWSEIWKATTTKNAIIANVRALQFQFSENGRDWIDDPSGKRQLQKLIKIQLLVRSSRKFDEKYSVNFKVGDLDWNNLKEDGVLYRLYEKVVEIPNNGIIKP